MAGCVRKSVFALLAVLVCVALAQEDTDVPTSNEIGFQQHILINDFQFGKLHQDALDPNMIIVTRLSSIARFRVNVTEYSIDTIVGSDNDKSIVDATGTEARFFYIFDLAQITDQRMWIVSELTYNCLRKIDIDTLEVSTFSGTCDIKAAAETTVGALSETKWSLPGLMTYSEAEQKLYIASDGGLREIDMITSQVEVIEPMLGTVYAMFLTERNTLVLLQNSVINELNPAESRESSMTRWNKDDTGDDTSFSFIFDMAKVDDDRVIIADDRQGLWLLNIATGDLVSICAGGKTTLPGGSEETCYEEPSSVQHISFIKNNLFILSHWAIDTDSSFQLTVFMDSSIPPPAPQPDISMSESGESILEPVNAISNNATTENTTMSSTSMSNISMPNTTISNTIAETTNFTENITDVVNVTTPTLEVDNTTVSMVNATENVTKTVNVMTTEETSLEGATTSSMMNETATNSTMELPEDDNVTSVDTTTEEESKVNLFDTTPVDVEVTMTTEDVVTKFPEIKTPIATTPSEKPGKSGVGAAKDGNAASERMATHFICWSAVLATIISLLAH